MSKDTKAIIGTIVGTGLVVAALLSAQMSSLNTRIDGLHARFDDLTASMNARFDDLTASANARFDDVHGRIDDVNANVNARIDDVVANVNARIDDVVANVNARFDDLQEDIRELRALVIEALKRTEPAD